MGISGGPNIIKNGLVLLLDGADVFQSVNRNLLSYTNDLTNATWSKTGLQITSNATTAPDGTNTAFAMSITDATGLVRLRQSPVNASGDGPYTFSVYVKQNTSTAQLLDTGLYNSSISLGSEPSYNILNNFAVTGANGAYVSNRVVTSVGNGWYRIATTATIPNATAWYLFFDIEAGTGTKVNGQGIYLWGPQFEYGTTATEYQPVNTTTRTWPDLVNSSNNGTLTNGSTFNSTNGGNVSFDGIDDFCQGTIPGNTFSGASTILAWWRRTSMKEWSAIFSNNVGTTSCNLFTYQSTSNLIGINQSGVNASGTWIDLGTHDNLWIFGALVLQGSTNGSTVQVYAYKQGSLLTSTGTLYWNLSTGSSYYIGRHYQGAVQVLNGNISCVCVYNRALSASEIQQNYNAQKSRFNL